MFRPSTRPGAGSIVALAFILACSFGSSEAPVASEAAPPPPSPGGPAPAASIYEVRMVSASPPKLAVRADLPILGEALRMDTTRPALIPELDAGGWPSLVSRVVVKDTAGRPVATTSAGEAGWKLARPLAGRLSLEYEVDYSPLAARGWPAPREAALADADHLAFVGRSLFITTPDVGSSTVRFELPAGWHAATPWVESSRQNKEFAVDTPGDLVENLVVLSRAEEEHLSADGFQVIVAPMGHWEPARHEVRRVLGAVIPHLVGLMGAREPGRYLVVLLPVVDSGGESFRSSFAMTVEAPPSRADSAAWGNTVAHEIFHYWNGWRLSGSDYASSQWFQEGFTEYAANVAMVASGLISAEAFASRLSNHVRNYRALTTSLLAPGTRKGPPLYSGGALAAFSWDIQIRESTGGRRSLGDFFRDLWERTGRGGRPYDWEDIQAALEATAPGDWRAFFDSHIRGVAPLPLEQSLSRVGLSLGSDETGGPHVAVDPAASATAKSAWAAVIEGR